MSVTRILAFTSIASMGLAGALVTAPAQAAYPPCDRTTLTKGLDACTVQPGLTHLDVKLVGGAGGAAVSGTIAGGTGATVVGTVDVTGLTLLHFTVGSNGSNGTFSGGGGAYSAVSTQQNVAGTELAVAGGGGGAGTTASGGNGGISGATGGGAGGADGTVGGNGGTTSAAGNGGGTLGGNGGAAGGNASNGGTVGSGPSAVSGGGGGGGFAGAGISGGMGAASGGSLSGNAGIAGNLVTSGGGGGSGYAGGGGGGVGAGGGGGSSKIPTGGKAEISTLSARVSVAPHPDVSATMIDSHTFTTAHASATVDANGSNNTVTIECSTTADFTAGVVQGTMIDGATVSGTTPTPVSGKCEGLDSAKNYWIRFGSTNAVKTNYGTAATLPGSGAAAQRPATACVTPPPSKTRAGRSRKLMKPACTTNAGKAVAVRVTSAPTSRGDLNYFRLVCVNGKSATKTRSAGYGTGFRYCSKGTMVMKTQVRRVRLKITWYAPAVSGYTAYQLVQATRT